MSWTTALAHALVGPDGDPRGPGDRDDSAVSAGAPSNQPDLDAVLASVGGVDRVLEFAEARTSAGQPWPVPVDRPDGVGPAQWAALLTAATQRIGRVRAARRSRVLSSRSPDGDELRLLREVPPHHGS